MGGYQDYIIVKVNNARALSIRLRELFFSITFTYQSVILSVLLKREAISTLSHQLAIAAL